MRYTHAKRFETVPHVYIRCLIVLLMLERVFFFSLSRLPNSAQFRWGRVQVPRIVSVYLFNLIEIGRTSGCPAPIWDEVNIVFGSRRCVWYVRCDRGGLRLVAVLVRIFSCVLLIEVRCRCRRERRPPSGRRGRSGRTTTTITTARRARGSTGPGRPRGTPTSRSRRRRSTSAGPALSSPYRTRSSSACSTVDWYLSVSHCLFLTCYVEQEVCGTNVRFGGVADQFSRTVVFFRCGVYLVPQLKWAVRGKLYEVFSLKVL